MYTFVEGRGVFYYFNLIPNNLIPCDNTIFGNFLYAFLPFQASSFGSLSLSLTSALSHFVFLFLRSYPKTKKSPVQSSYQNMGSATSIISPEPVLAAAAVAGALGYGYVHYVRPAQRSDDVDDHADASTSKTAPSVAASLHGQKKRGRKLHLPGDATLKNLDVLEAPSLVLGSRSASSSSAPGTRQRQRRQPIQPPPPPPTQHQREAPAAQPQDVVPGGFDDNVSSAHDLHDTPQDQQSQAQSQQQQQQGVSATGAAAKKPKKKKGRKAASATPSEPSSSPLATSTLTEGSAAPGASVGKGKKVSASASAAAEDGHDERWTRVEARKKKASVRRQDDAAAASGADVTTSDAGITTSVTGNSSPVTERTTEDELPSELDECVHFIFHASCDRIYILIRVQFTTCDRSL